MSDYIREWLPPGVLNVVTGGHDFGPWMTSHSGIDLITFTRSRNIGKRVLESAAGTLKPVTLELGGNDSRTVTDADLEKTALFGRILLSPVNWKPGRYGLASTLCEILSFQPRVIRTQVLVWSLARKASNTHPLTGCATEAGETVYEMANAPAAATADLHSKDRKATPISLLKILHCFKTAYRLGRERYRQRSQLMEMDDRQLKDIGITREQAEREARKPFWK